MLLDLANVMIIEAYAKPLQIIPVIIIIFKKTKVIRLVIYQSNFFQVIFTNNLIKNKLVKIDIY